MYAPTSTSLPRSGLISGDNDGLTDFDGAAEILRTWGAGLTPAMVQRINSMISF